MSAQLLRGATIVHHEADDDAGDVTHRTADVRIVEGVIAEVGSLTPTDGEAVVDLDGYLLLPAAVEPHAHLDKAFLAERIANPTGDLLGAVTAMDEHRASLTVADIVDRAERAARRLAANGYRAVRTHADTITEHGLRSVEGLVEVKRRVADVIDVEVVALCGWPLMGAAGAEQRALAHEALAAGADLLGGCPHLEGGDTRGPTEFLLQTATDHGVGVDLHTDETLDPGVLGLVDLAELVAAGFEHPVTASHCVSLGMQSADRQREIAELVAAAGIGVVTLPHTNLFLQGRGHAPMPRGLTAVAALRAAGVRVAAGADNLQDPFNPVGRACPFETAGLTVLTAHLLPAEAWAATTSVAADVVGAPPLSIAPGAAADLLATRATTLREAIAFGPADRIVWHRGQRLPT